MPYIKNIGQNSTDSNQTSPGYVLTCLRWDNRDTYNYQGDPLKLRQPLVIINDAIAVTVQNTKQGLTPTMSATLKGGDLNYATALSPGDFIMVNLLNWETDVWRVANKARSLQQINRKGDGFKGLFKIQTVRKNIKVAANGVKMVTYTVHAAGFTEFNNVVMYNPAIVAAFSKEGTDLYSAAIGDFYNTFIKSHAECQTVVRALFKILLGKSYKDKDLKVPSYGNTHFKMPISVGKLLGIDNAKYAADIYNIIIGIWSAPKSTPRGLAAGMNPSIKDISNEGGNNFETSTPIQGNKLINIENWNNVQSWSIIKNNINQVMNEMYTTFRIDKNGNVMPTVIVRQKPFTTEHFKKPSGFPVTKFFELPRWKISPNLLLSMDIGKNEAARMNFVQVFTRALASTAAEDHAAQISFKNFQYDQGDIKRNGLKPYVVTANFDFPVKGGQNEEGLRTRAKEWSQIVSDWVIDGHQKSSGTLKFVGIQDPISVGDNLEIDGVVFHIESVQHAISISGGKKSFRTNLTVSYGVDLRSNKSRPVYAEMEHTDAHTMNIEDYNTERLLPGTSDTQLSLGRDKADGEELKETRQKSFTLKGKPKPKKSIKENNGNVSKPDKDSGRN